MSAELIQGPSRPRGTWWRALGDVALVLTVAALAGAVCGALWELWWTPPMGLVLDHVWYPDEDGLRQLFAGTGLYVAVAVGGGVVLGALSAWLFNRVELVTLGAVLVGSVLAGWTMFEVGTALAPPDPAAEARTADDYTTLPGSLEVDGTSAFVAFPAGALTAITVVFITVAPTRRNAG